MICVRYRYTLMAEAARWCLMLSNDMHSVFSSNFLLISKYNCGARNGKHIPLALHKGDLSRVIFVCILPCWDLWESLHGYVLTFKIYLSAFTSTPPQQSYLMVWYFLPCKSSVSSCLWKVFLWRKRCAWIASLIMADDWGPMRCTVWTV